MKIPLSPFRESSIFSVKVPFKGPAFAANHLKEMNTHILAQTAKREQEEALQKSDQVAVYLTSVIDTVQVGDQSFSITAQDIFEEIILQHHKNITYYDAYDRHPKPATLFKNVFGWRSVPEESTFKPLSRRAVLACLDQLENLGLVRKKEYHPDDDLYKQRYYLTAMALGRYPELDQINRLNPGYDLPETNTLRKIKAYLNTMNTPEYLYERKRETLQSTMSEVLGSFSLENDISKAVYGWDVLDAFYEIASDPPPDNSRLKERLPLKKLKTLEPFCRLDWKVLKRFMKKLLQMGIIARYSPDVGNIFERHIPDLIGDLFESSLVKTPLGHKVLQKTQPWIEELKAAGQEKLSEDLTVTAERQNGTLTPTEDPLASKVITVHEPLGPAVTYP